MTSASDLFIADATTLGLGEDAYELTYARDSGIDGEFRLIDYRAVTTEWNENWYSATLARSSTETILKVFEYRNPEGPVGFHDRVDSTALALLEGLFEDAWIWSANDSRFVSYAEVRSRLQFPSQFIWTGWQQTKEPRPYPFICYHGPNDSLKSMMRAAGHYGHVSKTAIESQITEFYRKRGPDKLQTLLHMASDCLGISVWSPELSRPRILSYQGTLIMRLLQDLCARNNTRFKTVDSEDLLPSW
jgi:hypothetical protein